MSKFETNAGRAKRRGACCCGDPRCYKLSKRIAQIDPFRDGTVLFPSKPRAVMLMGANSDDRQQQQFTTAAERILHKRERWLHYLGAGARDRVLEAEAAAEAKIEAAAEKSDKPEKAVNFLNLHVSLAHFHPVIVSIFRRTDQCELFGATTSSAPAGAKLKFPLTVEYAVGRAIGLADEDLQINQEGPVRHFSVVPHYSFDDLLHEVEMKEYVGTFSCSKSIRERSVFAPADFTRAGSFVDTVRRLDPDDMPGYVSSSMAISMGMKKGHDAEDIPDGVDDSTVGDGKKKRKRRSSTAPIGEVEFELDHQDLLIRNNLGGMASGQVAVLLKEYDRALRQAHSMMFTMRDEMCTLIDACSKAERINQAGRTCATRGNLTSDEWHATHPDAAKYLFGYPTWYDAKNAVDTSDDAFYEEEMRMTSVNAPLSSLEQHLVRSMHLKRKWEFTLLGYIWGKSRCTIERVVHPKGDGQGMTAGRSKGILAPTMESMQQQQPPLMQHQLQQQLHHAQQQHQQQQMLQHQQHQQQQHVMYHMQQQQPVHHMQRMAAGVPYGVPPMQHQHQIRGPEDPQSIAVNMLRGRFGAGYQTQGKDDSQDVADSDSVQYERQKAKKARRP